MWFILLRVGLCVGGLLLRLKTRLCPFNLIVIILNYEPICECINDVTFETKFNQSKPRL